VIEADVWAARATHGQPRTDVTHQTEAFGDQRLDGNAQPAINRYNLGRLERLNIGA
jgi:hypothetical protein